MIVDNRHQRVTVTAPPKAMSNEPIMNNATSIRILVQLEME